MLSANNVLTLALTARDYGCRPSAIIGLDPALAISLDLDAACSYSLLEFDNKREYERLGAFAHVMKLAVSEAVSEVLDGNQRDGITTLFSPEKTSEKELSEDDIL